MEPEQLDTRAIRLRYAGRCDCGTVLEVGTRAAYDKVRRKVICPSCLTPSEPPTGEPPTVGPPAPPAPGTPGASTAREFDRRVAKRDAQTESMKRGLRRFVRSHTPPPTSTQVWRTGAVGEQKVAAALAALAGDYIYALHDRGVPRSRANIDHIAIGPSGIHVIDAKHYPGAAIAVRREVRWRQPTEETLLVRGRKRNDLLLGLEGQVLVVRQALADAPELAHLPVQGALCFIGANFPLFPRSMSVMGVPVVGRAGLRRLVVADGDVDIPTRYAAYCRLAAALREN
ncbi:MAG: nuclease-related domain-containing protein [Dermatophilaceae bacterium]